MSWFKRKSYPFTEQFVSYAPTGEGVYAIMTADNKTIYIGQSKTLQKRLMQHLKKQDPNDDCIWRYNPASYYREECSNSELREKELLKEYRTYCNKIIA